VHIDHVICATSNLDEAAAQIESELGLSSVAGGRHEGLGTHNRIVPLGDGSFIELLAIADAQEAKASPLGAAVLAGIARGEGLFGWAVAVEDVGLVAARLGTPVSTVGRQGMTASLTGLTESFNEPYLPFFIQRVAARFSPDAARSIDWIEVAGDARRLERWLGEIVLPVRVLDGSPGVRAVAVEGRELRSPPPRPRPDNSPHREVFLRLSEQIGAELKAKDVGEPEVLGDFAASRGRR
jgi:hypothetical protein